MNDLDFVNAVVERADLKKELARQGLDRIETYGRGSTRNDGMKISKSAWMLPLPAPGVRGIDIHLEARKPGELQLDVEVFPYEGSIDKDLARQAELREVLNLKAELLDLLRRSLNRQCDVEATAHGLLSTEAVKCLCAVKFTSGLGPKCSVDAYVAFLVRALQELAPRIDDLLEAHAKRKAQRCVES
jgi:hypothetical protein